VHLAGQDRRQELLLLLLGAVLLQGGPTVCSVTAGNGTSARAASLTKMLCSTGPYPSPPYSLGQPTPSLPSAPIRRITAR